MQQLTLQFEGYADSRRPETRGTAKRCLSNEPGRLVPQIGAIHAANPADWCRQSLASVRAWLAGRSDVFTALCGEGEAVTRLDVAKAHLALAAQIILIVIGGAL